VVNVHQFCRDRLSSHLETLQFRAYPNTAFDGTLRAFLVGEWSPKPHGGVSMAGDSALRFHQIPEALWERIDFMIPVYKSSCKGGRPRLPIRNFAGGILYVLATGCQWKAMPKQFGSGSAIHAHFL
jgi:Putative transposase of IS4/5 family (DUF4096)